MTEETNNTTRQSRESENHANNTRRKPWTPVRKLETPEPPEGYEYRWIRESMLGQEDRSNVSKRLREGWEPCKAKDHPEITLVTIEQERFAENVVIGGLMLCKAPIELVEERTEHFETQTQSQMASVDNNLMRENDARMPLFNERQSKVTFGQGN